MGEYRRKTVAVLASGGVDSACLLAWASERSRRVQPIYVTFGLRWERAEQNALRRFVRALGRRNVRAPVILRLSARELYGKHWSLGGARVPGSRSRDAAVYLPGRNLLLLSKAAVYCAGREIETIAVGTLAANPFSDASPEFFSDFSRLAGRALGRRIRVIAPFRRLGKAALIRRYANLPLAMCFSCLNPSRGKACGRCNKCVEWRKSRLVLTSL